MIISPLRFVQQLKSHLNRNASCRKRGRKPLGGESCTTQALEPRIVLSADSLDPSFGNVGQVLTDFTPTAGTNDEVTAVRSLANGKTLVAGNINAGPGSTSGLARYNSNGTLDTTFGDGGRIATSLLTNANDVQVLSNGSILVAGRSLNSNGNDESMAVLKLTSSGLIDESFGSRGLAIADFFGNMDEALSLAVQSDGKILVAGTTNNGNDLDFAVARFNTDGTLDTTYDTDGKVTVDFVGAFANRDSEAREIKIDPASGKAVVAGYAFDGNDRDFALIRLTTQGSLDTTFDTDGRVTTDFPGGKDDEAFSLVIGSSSIITAGGFTEQTDRDFALVQYNSSGSLRSSFDTDGRVITDFSRGDTSVDQIFEIKLDSSNRIVAAGGAFEFDPLNTREDFAMARYSASTGAIDAALGDGGKIYSSFYASRGEQAKALDLDSSGKWVVGGFTYVNNETLFGTFRNFGILRLNGTNASVDSAFGNQGQVITDFSPTSGTDDELTAVRSLPDGKTLVVGNSRGFGGFASTSLLSRYNSNGTLDTTFGDGGRIATSLLTNANDVQVLSNGSILVAGRSLDSSNNDESMAVLKLTSSGLIDESFGSRGLAIADFFGNMDEALSLAIQTDGKILVAGTTNNGNDFDFAVARFNTDGTLDTTYDTDGKVTVDFVGAFANRDSEAREIKIDPASGKAVVAGYAFDGNDRDFALIRLTTQGSLDTTFDTDGRVTTDFPGGKDDEAFSLVIGSSSIITAGGFTEQTDRDFALVQYNSSGSLRSSFDTDGRVITDFSRGDTSVDQIFEIKLDSSNRIVAAGGAFEFDPLNTREDFAMARYSASTGAIDAALGDGGKIYSSFYASRGEQAKALDLDSNGKWVVGGFTFVNYEQFFGTSRNFAIARFGEAKPDGTAGNDTFVLTYSSTSTSGTVTVTISTDGGPTTTLGTFPMNTPLTVNGLGGTDTVRVQGTSSGDTISVTSSGLTVNGSSLILSSVENRTLAGLSGSDTYRFDADGTLGLYSIDESVSGTDTIDFTPTTTLGVSLSLSSASTQTVNSRLSLKLGSGAEIERVIGSSKNDTLIGNSLANTITGNAGDDIISGGSNSDSLIGGLGNDTYVFGGATVGGEIDTITEAPGEGTDTVDFSSRTIAVSINIGDSVKQQQVHTDRKIKLSSGLGLDKIIGGSSHDILAGNSLPNTIIGNGGNDTMSGGSGSDSLIGGLGNDTYVFRSATVGGELDTITESPGEGSDTVDFSDRTIGVTINIGDSSSQQQVHTDRKVKLSSGLGIDKIIGGSSNDTLTGNSLANTITGNAGNDVISGGLGSDSLIGGLGNDTYVFGGATTGGETDTITEAGGEGSDTVDFSSRTIGVTINIGDSSNQQQVHTGRKVKLSSGLGIDKIIGGSSNDTLTGNSLANTITGNAGNDVISGGLGSDSLIGGPGSDRYVFGGATVGGELDTVTEASNLDRDTLDFSNRSTNVTMNISDSSNQQQVHADRKIKLSSGLGIEIVLGGSGNDKLTGNSIANVLVGNSGNDTLIGNSGRDILIGGNGLDTINGGNDDDILIAGRTTSDASPANLSTLLTGWLSSSSYATRVSALRAGVGSPKVSLVKKSNVLTDAGEKDSLTGGAGTDWFFKATNDVIADLFSGEQIDVL